MIFEQTWPDVLARAFVLASLALVWIVVLVRINGLRSLSKMTNFDFVMTIALGSLVAGAAQAEEWAGFAQSLVAMAALFCVQWLAARLRKISDALETALQNRPVLLMRDGRFLDRAMDDARVTRSDLLAKLREANVLDLAEVRAVVLETTGDISVLHGTHLEDTLIEGIDGEGRAP